jgi:hypothetical protein
MLCCAHLFLAAITAGEEAVDAAGAATGAETRESTGVEGGEDSVAQGYSRIDQRRRRGGLRRGGRRGGEGKAAARNRGVGFLAAMLASRNARRKTERQREAAR